MNEALIEGQEKLKKIVRYTIKKNETGEIRNREV